MNTLTISNALIFLQQSKIIAYPTEAVYGLGCDPDDEIALQKLIELKCRDPSKGLILIADDFAKLEKYLEKIPEEHLQKVLATWPGAYTWIFPAKQSVSKLLTGKHHSLAVRVTNHPIAKSLCKEFGKALVSTSANLEGQPPAKTSHEVIHTFGDKIAGVVEGKLGNHKNPTEIRDVMTGKVIRST